MEDAPVVLPIQLTPAQVRPVAYRIISKKHGLNLKSAALDVLARFLGHHFGADWRGPQAERSLDEISRRWKDEDRGIFVDGAPLAQVIKDWLNAEVATKNSSQGEGDQKFDWRQYFKVVNATDQKKFVYDSAKKGFELPADPSPHPFGDAKSLTSVFSTRYYVLLDKLFRNEMFQSSGMSTVSSSISGATVYTISPIKNLLGRSPGSEFFLFGLLEKQEDGPWAIYDPTSSINLEFSENTVFAPDHYYTSGSFVLCHGHFMGEFFQVATLGPPPPERRTVSQEAYGHIDFYGLNGGANRKSQRIERVDPSLLQIMVNEEQKMEDNRIVIAGANIFLDQTPVVDALRRMMLELESNPPIAIVLPGSFVSLPFQPHLTTSDGRNAAQVYRDGMNSLADILTQCPQLAANTKIILIPGSNDPWHSTSLDVLPYRPLPQVFTGRVERAASDVTFATNPSRLCYLSHEMVLFRNDIGAKLRKFSLDTDAITQKDSDAPASSQANGDHSEHVLTAEVLEANNSIRELSLDDKSEERAAERAAVETMIDTSTNMTATNLVSKDRALISDTQEARRVMATLLDQSHLCPFPISKSAVTWEFDQTLSLAQWPTSLVVIDPTTPAIKQVYEDCNVINPGSFWYNGRANWLEFWPSTGDFKFADSF